MTFLTDAQAQQLTIERMIFHVVRPEDEAPLFLAEVEPPQFTDFFIDRVQETLKGSSYVFREGSGIPNLFRRAGPEADADEFVQVSRDLATRFKQTVGTDKRLAPGVLMLFSMTALDKRLFGVLKYEHQQVITYEVEADEDGNLVPDLKSIIDTFTKDKKCLQKSALVLIEDLEDDDKIIVIDHSASKYRDATHHFANFMDIRRALEASAMTKRLVDATLATIEKHKAELPANIGCAPKRVVHDAIRQLVGFDHERTQEYLNAVFGGLPDDSPIRNTFQRSLAARGLGTEAFEFDRAELPQRPYRRVLTNEGISLSYHRELEEQGRVIIEPQEGGGKRITINTTGIVKDDDSEKAIEFRD